MRPFHPSLTETPVLGELAGVSVRRSRVHVEAARFADLVDVPRQRLVLTVAAAL
jgi:hypothetical protein